MYLDPMRCNTLEERNYHKIFRSKRGFKIGTIFYMIMETYREAIDDLHDGDESSIESLGFSSFYFDAETNSVYPATY